MSILSYGTDYFGFVYLWYDSHRKMFYLGSHYGSEDDGYICSNKWMKAAYKKRPKDFKRRVIKYLEVDDLKLLQQYEQHYLDMIKDEELSISESVMTGKNRYYNMKKNAAGGNGSANKGQRKNAPPGISYTWIVVDPEGNEHIVDRLYYFCETNNLNKDSLWLSYTKQRPSMRGTNKGWFLKQKVE